MTSAIAAFLLAPTGSTALTILIAKSSLVLGVGLLLWKFLGRAPASVRHMVLGATLVSVLLLPVIAIVSPPLQVPIDIPHTETGETFVNPAPAVTLVTKQAASEDAGSVRTSVSATTPGVATKDAIALAYVAGVALVLLYLLIGIIRISFVSHRARPTSSEALQYDLSSAGVEKITTKFSSELDAPLTWGVRRPEVLLPAEAETWRENDLQNALQHELAHVERRDWLMQILARFICAIYWFNPLVWIALRQLTLEAELAADDRVLRAGATPHNYAAQLITLAKKSRTKSIPLAATTMAEHSTLSRRVRTILNHGGQQMPLNQTGRYALLSVVIVSAILIGSAQLVAAPQQDANAPGKSLTENFSTPLIRAAARGDNEEVERLLRSGVDVNEISNNRGPQRELSRSALTTAAAFGHLDVVNSLLAAGAPIDRVVRGDATALIAATRNNHFDITQRLVALGADVNKTVRGDGSPLIAATVANNAEAVRFLLEQGADPDMSVKGDENPLYHAARNGNDEIMDMLIDAGVDIDQEWPGDGTALIVATNAGNTAVVESLMLAGAKPDQGVKGDGNAMIVAAQRGDTAMLQKMIATGADVNATVRGDGSPLIQAARNGHMDAAVLLVQAGADVNQVVYGDENALIGAAWAGDVEMVDFLLRNGADPTIKAETYGGKTRSALSQATLEGHERIILMLRDAGATE